MTKDAVSFKRESCAERVQWVASWLDFANSSAVPRYRGDFFGSGGSMAQGKERADELVFAQGLAESREMAKRLIMAGKVALEDVSGVRQKVDKPGHKYPLDTAFALVGIEKYVSRGAYKLLTAIEHFKLDVTGFVCLDAGASTGGFTDCLLQHGAAKVYAVDVGKEQLHERMRRDPRVISMEGTNLRTAPEELIPEPVDIIVADVSFISLTLILPPCVRWSSRSLSLGRIRRTRGWCVIPPYASRRWIKCCCFARSVSALSASASCLPPSRGPREIRSISFACAA